MHQKKERRLEIQRQPDDTTCGPTCLHAVYRYHGDEIPLAQVIQEVPAEPGGGTHAVCLACHALRRGYRARIYTYNLQAFDPT
ncbi:MAG: cysteine peptidase family C39 domain-containing protein, partial [Acidobacteria bacterium]|nr:cysteine peptidase family C39 domain-containing protein [Acidobacteriota bacterium]